MLLIHDVPSHQPASPGNRLVASDLFHKLEPKWNKELSQISTAKLCLRLARGWFCSAQLAASKIVRALTIRASTGFDFIIICSRSTPHVGLHRFRLGVPQRLPAGITILLSG